MSRRSPEIAPKYSLYRDLIKTVDSGPYTEEKHGVNMADYAFANIQVLAGHAADNPNIQVLYWSEELGQFIPDNTALSFTGIGAGKPYEVSVKTYGRIIFVEVTGTINGASAGIKILVSGYGLNHTA